MLAVIQWQTVAMWGIGVFAAIALVAILAWVTFARNILKSFGSFKDDFKGRGR